jgi:hypothetical protein
MACNPNIVYEMLDFFSLYKLQTHSTVCTLYEKMHYLYTINETILRMEVGVIVRECFLSKQFATLYIVQNKSEMLFEAVLRIRIRIRINRIHMFLGLPDPDPLVRGMDPDPAPDPDPSTTMQK